MATPQIIIVKKTAKKRRTRRDRSPESRRRKHEMHRKKRAMRGGFLPQLTAAYNIAKVVKPASRISEIVDIIPGARGKLEGNAIGRVFLKGLDLGKSFGFGSSSHVKKTRKRRSHKRKSHRKGAGTHSSHSTRMHRRKAVHKRGRGVIIA